MPKTAMCGGLRKTEVSLVVRRVRKGDFVRRYRFLSCVYTEVHMFTCLFVHIILHMTYTNVILFLWDRHSASEVTVSLTLDKHSGLGRACNMKVCALGSDLMW